MPKKTKKKEENKEKSVAIDNHNKSAQVLLVFVIILLILGGFIIWYQKYRYENEKKAQLQQVESSLQSRIIDLQNDIDKAMSESNQKEQNAADLETELNDLKLELLESKVQIGLQDLWGVDSLVADTDHPGMYYFFTSDATGGHIHRYDATKYLNDVMNFELSLSDISGIYTEKIGKNDEWRLARVYQGKLLFVQTTNDDSPGPCYQLILDDRLIALDLGVKDAEPAEYTLPADMKTAAQEDSKKCYEEIANDAINQLENQ